jgi:hypothetical protein
VVLEEIKMVEDTPDDLVHEIFSEHLWENHPLGRPILGTPDSVSALSQDVLRRYFTGTYVAPEHDRRGRREHRARAGARAGGKGVRRRASRGTPLAERPPQVVPRVVVRNKELEQSHVCLGTSGYQQDHATGSRATRSTRCWAAR